MTRGVAPSFMESRQPPTPRQREVLRLLAQGLHYDEVGRAMGLPTQTVKNHASLAYHRMKVDSAIQAFIHLGWLRPDA